MKSLTDILTEVEARYNTSLAWVEVFSDGSWGIFYLDEETERRATEYEGLSFEEDLSNIKLS